jgi:hypothetical protein
MAGAEVGPGRRNLESATSAREWTTLLVELPFNGFGVPIDPDLKSLRP